jgi:uncharacterized membrane protein
VSGAQVGLVVSVFLACGVEAVEALTIVLAVGGTRSWPSALAGAGTAGVALIAVVLALGSALTSLPLGALRLTIGVALLAFGLHWLRKAVLRAAGLKALRDERAAYAHERDVARAARRARSGWDAYSFIIAGKGVLLEGLEVALIVVTFGSDRHRLALAGAAAGLAVAAVAAAGFAVRAPLARVPENTMKYAVGVMLCSYGLFFVVEGAGQRWPGGEAILPAIVALALGLSLFAVRALRRAAA